MCSGDSPFTRAMFSPRPTLSFTLLMSLAGDRGHHDHMDSFLLSRPTPPLALWSLSSHLVLQADLGPNDVGGTTDHSESEVLLGTWLG